MRFFWDMDGVVYDFDSLFKMYMPGVNMEDDSAWTWQELYAKCPTMYWEGGWMPGMKDVWERTKSFGDHYVLTALPKRWHWPDAAKHKRLWATTEMGLHQSKVRFGPFAVDKQFHCTGPTDVLIDDRIRNIEQWIAQGGTGIRHTDPETTLKALMGIINPYHT